MKDIGTKNKKGIQMVFYPRVWEYLELQEAEWWCKDKGALLYAR